MRECFYICANNPLTTWIMYLYVAVFTGSFWQKQFGIKLTRNCQGVEYLNDMWVFGWMWVMCMIFENIDEFKFIQFSNGYFQSD